MATSKPSGVGETSTTRSVKFVRGQEMASRRSRFQDRYSEI
jgi:hypothetical protein